jgi:hypothetical protein
MAVKAFIPPNVGDQDHIIRRLGWAVVRNWSSLPAEVQADVYQQALYVQDKNRLSYPRNSLDSSKSTSCPSIRKNDPRPAAVRPCCPTVNLDLGA